jgi:protein SCO1/2
VKKLLTLMVLVLAVAGTAVEMFYRKGVPSEAGVTPGGLARFATVPDFSLTDRSGARVSLGDLKGKVWLADFIYTSCPDSCPMLSSRLAEWQKEILATGDVRLVSFSVDPSHDSPEVLQRYATRFAASDRWFFLTGDKAQVAQIARKGFLLGLENDPRTSGSSPGISHSTKIALVDKGGVVRGYYDGVGPDEHVKLLADLRTLLRER